MVKIEIKISITLLIIAVLCSLLIFFPKHLDSPWLFVLLGFLNSLIINIILFQNETVKYLVRNFLITWLIQSISLFLYLYAYYSLVLLVEVIRYPLTFLGLKYTHSKTINLLHIIWASIVGIFLWFVFTVSFMGLAKLFGIDKILGDTTFFCFIVAYTTSLSTLLSYIQEWHEKTKPA